MEQDIDHCQSPLYDDSSFIPADYNYFNINLITQDIIADFPIGLFIVPFRNNSVQFTDVLKDLYKILSIDEKQYPINRISLSLSEGNPVKKVSTIQDLRLKLCRQSASGITLRAKLTNGFVQEAAANFFYHNESEYNGQLKVDKLFVLLNNQEPFYVCMQKNIKARKLQEIIVKSLNDFYKNNLANEGHIKFYKTERCQNKQTNTIQWIKKQEIKGLEIENYLRLTQKNVIGIDAIKEDSIWPNSEVNNQQFLIIYLDKDTNFKLKFSQIQKYTVQQLLESIQIKGAQCFGLKIINQIFKPRQFISEIAKYFKQGQGKYIKNIQCRLIDQREMFYREMGNFKEDYVIEKTLVTHSKQHQYEKCRQLARNRIEQKQIREKFIFKCAQEISPIAFYTSSVQVIDGNSSVLLYKGLNENLRQKKFGMVKIDYQKDWKYKFTATLNRSLLKLKEYSPTEFKTFYRGVKGHILQCEEGQIYVEKQYASTTLSLQKAENWIKNSPAATLITIQAKSGRLIQDFSLYKSQQQVLFMPYTYFEVIKKKLITKDKINRLQVTFRQLEISQYKSNPASYILWIDDKLKEGEKVIGSLDCPMHTTFLHQLKSNKQLKQWIKNNQDIINNEKIQIGVITNMRRIQDGVEEKAAGAQTIRIIQEKMKRSKNVCYVNYIDGAKNALKQKGLNPEQVNIINKRLQLRKFIAQVTQPQEQQQDITKSLSVVIQKKRQIKKIFNINQTS